MRKRSLSTTLIGASVLLAAVAVGGPAAWASLVWDGGGGDANWSTAANWDDDVAPTASADVLHFAGSTQTTPNNDYTGGSYAGIQFDSGAGAFTLAGNSITLGSGGIVNASSNAQTINLGMTIGSAINVNATGHVTAGGNLAGSGAITKTGAGTLILNGINSNYSGSVTVNAGGLTLNSTSASGTGAINAIANSGTAVTLNIGGSADGANFSNSLNLTSYNSGNSTYGRANLINYTATGATLSGAVTLSGNYAPIIIYANTSSNTSSNLTISGDITGNFATGSFLLLRGNYTTGSGYITGKVNLNGATLYKTDAGLWYINSTGNSWGTTGIAAGQIALGADDALPTTTDVVLGQASGLGYLYLNGHNQTVASITSSTATGAGGYVYNGSTVTATLTINNSNDVSFGKSGYAGIGKASYSGAQNNVALTKSGAGVLTLGGPNYHTGATRIVAGTLTLGDSLALQRSTVNLDASDAGALSFGTLTAATFGGLAGSRDLALTNASAGAVALTIGSGIYAGSLAGATTITKVGGGDFVLTTDTNTASTTADTINWSITAGRLFFDSQARLGAGNVAVGSGATLCYNWGDGWSGVDLTLGNALTLQSGANLAARNGALTVPSMAALPTSGTVTFNNDDADTVAVNVGGGSLTLAGDLTVQVGGAKVTTNAVGDVTIGGAITGDYGLTKTSTGKLILTGANTYAGSTTVENGTLSIDTAYLSDTANVSIAGGAALDLNFTGTDTIKMLYLDGMAAAAGTWGATGSGAEFTSGLLTGSGMLNVTVPEPGALAMLSAGLIGLIAYVWRKRK